MTDLNKASGSSPTRKCVPPPADFSLENHGGIFLLVPQSTSARVWIDDHIGTDTGYQPYYPTVLIEHRYVSDIVEGIQNDGLAVQL